MKAIIVMASPSEDDIKADARGRFGELGWIVNRNFANELQCCRLEDISMIKTAEMDDCPDVVGDALKDFFMQNHKEDICLCYIGHGLAYTPGRTEGWALAGVRDRGEIAYTELDLILAHHAGNLIFLNWCCHAGGAVDALRAHSGESLLVAAMPREVSGVPYKFFSTLFRDWDARTPFCMDDAHTEEGHPPVVVGNLGLQKLMYRRIL